MKGREASIFYRKYLRVLRVVLFSSGTSRQRHSAAWHGGTHAKRKPISTFGQALPKRRSATVETSLLAKHGLYAMQVTRATNVASGVNARKINEEVSYDAFLCQ